MRKAETGDSRSVGRRVLMGGVTAALVFVGMEVVLQLASLVSSEARRVLSVGQPLIVEDSLLGHRLNPRLAEHDEGGWRNTGRVATCATVALGDSQTYGQIVARGEAWPQSLAELTGRCVYNMGVPGYGPVEYYALLPEALELAPRTVFVALYSGNDFFGAYQTVYREGRRPELRSDDPEVLRAIDEAEAERGSLVAAWDATREARLSPWQRWLGESLDPVRVHSKLWGLGRALRRAARSGRREEAVEAGEARRYAQDEAGLLMPVSLGPIGTVLTPAQRLAVLDVADVRLAEGVRISTEVMVRMAASCGSRCDVVVVFLPTKELVYAPVVARTSQTVPASFERLLESERAIWDSLRAALGAAGVRWVDTLPALQQSVDEGVNPFPGDWNGHMNAQGNRVVARVLLDLVVAPAPASVGLALESASP